MTDASEIPLKFTFPTADASEIPLKFTFPMAPIKPKSWFHVYRTSLYVVCAGVTGFAAGYGTARYLQK